VSANVEYVMGYEISPHPKTIFSDPPPKVCLRRMGGEAPTYFTPSEARRFGEAMIQAAKDAEEGR